VPPYSQIPAAPLEAVMGDETKTREDLLRELEELRGLVSELNAARDHGFDAKQKQFNEPLERREGLHSLPQTDVSTLVDGEYSFKDLVDMESLCKVLEKFSSATGFTAGLVSFPTQEVLVATGWKEVCTKFHRAFPESARHCRQSNIELTKRLRDFKQLNTRACGNGMVDGATPVIVNGKHVASLFTGQCLFEEPDVNQFRNQATTYGYDVDEYLEALSKVRVVSKEEFEAVLSFLSEFAVLIAEQGLSRLKLKRRTCELEREIANRKSGEEAQRESEKRFRAIFDQTFQFTGLMTTDGILIEANRAALEFYGLSESDVLGMPFWETPWWTHSTEQQERLREAIKKAAAGDFVRFEASHPTPDGDIHYVDVSIKPLKDDEGIVSLLVPEGRDITERKRTDEALRASEERLRALSDASFEAIFLSEEGVCIGQNLTAEKMFGYSTQEALGRSGTEWISPEFRELVLGKMIEGHEEPYDAMALRKDGTSFHCEIQGRMVHYEGRRIRVTALRDITDRKKAEDALRESEQKLTSIVGASPVGIAMGRDRKISWTNEVWEKMFGLEDPSEHLGQSTRILYPSDEEYERAGKALYRDLKTVGAFSESDVLLKRKDGSVFDGHMRLTYLDVSDPDKGVIVACSDISDRKRSERAIKDSEQRLTQIIDFLPDATFVIDLEGKVLAWNRAIEKMTGVKAENILGKSNYEHALPFYGERRPVLIDLVNKRDEQIEGRYDFVREEGEILVSETPTNNLKLKDLHLWNIAGPLYDEQGEVIGAIESIRDITERKLIEEALRESEQRLELALTGADLGLWDWNLKTGKAVWSARMQGILGYTQKGVDSDLRSWKRQVHPDDWPHVSEVLNRHLEGMTTFFEVQYRNRCESGGWKWIQARGKVVEYDEEGNPFRMTGTALDITESKRLQEQLIHSQKMEAIGTLAGGIAHDVNNLLQIVLGQADMILLQKGMDERLAKSVEAIRRAARNGAELVKRILAFSRQAETETRPVSLSDEVRRVGELLRRTIPRMINIEMALVEDVRMIQADPSQLEQILLNLAVNATDAMPDGGRLILETRNETIREEYCRIHPEAKPGKYVLLTVSDTGQGMEKQVSDRIFEPFFTTKQPGEGTGLGLSMVFGIVKSHRGHINCYSEPGVGTTFKIYFPVAQVDMALAIQDTIEMPPGGIETLLLVDDEEAVRTLGAEMLESAGYTVLTAANGREGLKVYGQNKDQISLVILDLVMPEMSGRKCLEELLKMDPTAKVLIASGYAANGPAKETRESGAAGFISKPFDLKQILLAVRRSLDRDRKGH
jgi:two-component system cell cycle sensor histidine kinase/response regulator CckA